MWPYLGQLRSRASSTLVNTAVLVIEELEASFFSTTMAILFIFSALCGVERRDKIYKVYWREDGIRQKTPEDIRYTGKILSQGRDEASGGQLTELGGYSFPGRGDVNHWECSVAETSEGSWASALYWIFSRTCVLIFSSAPRAHVGWLRATSNL